MIKKQDLLDALREQLKALYEQNGWGELKTMKTTPEVAVKKELMEAATKTGCMYMTYQKIGSREIMEVYAPASEEKAKELKE